MKRTVNAASLALVIAVLLGTILTSAASGPNKVTWNGYTIPGTAIATIQHQPSYNDTEGHAMQARIRLIVQDEEDNISYTGYSYTTLVTNYTDTTIYSTSRSAYVPRRGSVFDQHAFYWFEESGWGQSFETTE